MLVSLPVAMRLKDTDPRTLGKAMAELDGLREVCQALEGQPVWLVGGAVRDLLLGAARADLDLVTEAEAGEIAALIGHVEGIHARFRTATATLGSVRVDVAEARREVYAEPGALPEVEPASLSEDLARRDFSVNAMALPLEEAPALIDPLGGLRDLKGGVLRALHEDSFRDDPTRALRAARYGARLGFDLAPQTKSMLRDVDLSTVSPDRVEAEIRRTMSESTAPEALDLLAAWGLAGISPEAGERVRSVRSLLASPAWADVSVGTDVIFEVATAPPALLEAASDLARTRPRRPSEGVAALEGHRPAEIILARVEGAKWLDDWARSWRNVEISITGSDLMDAGVPAGPAIGRGLDAALAAKLDGVAPSRAQELKVAREAAT